MRVDVVELKEFARVYLRADVAVRVKTTAATIGFRSYRDARHTPVNRAEGLGVVQTRRGVRTWNSDQCSSGSPKDWSRLMQAPCTHLPTDELVRCIYRV